MYIWAQYLLVYFQVFFKNPPSLLYLKHGFARVEFSEAHPVCEVRCTY